MNAQQLQTDKLALIGWIYNLQDVSLIDKLKSIQRKTVVKVYESSLKPMYKEELISRANTANLAIEKNEVISQDNLKKETENW